jgi:putative hemolysin
MAGQRQTAHTFEIQASDEPKSPMLLAQRGNLRVVLSRDAADVKAAQELRFQIFYEELKAEAADARILADRCDADRFDAFCDHLLVIDDEVEHGGSPHGGKVVGTYRLLNQPAARVAGAFYSQSEFDLSGLLDRHANLHFLELGRSCVLPTHRVRPVLELLWFGIWNHVRRNGIDVMFGCASLPGTDPDALNLPLSFLAHHFCAPEDWRVSARPARAVPMGRLPSGTYDIQVAIRSLPPLLRGYTRLGCFVGEGAVVDHQFNTTDVFVILPVAQIRSRYFARFGAPADPLLSC